MKPSFLSTRSEHGLHHKRVVDGSAATDGLGSASDTQTDLADQNDIEQSDFPQSPQSLFVGTSTQSIDSTADSRPSLDSGSDASTSGGYLVAGWRPITNAAGTAVLETAISSSGATGVQVQQALNAAGLNVTGVGIKVGVLSDSFNNLGGAASDEASGALPPTVQVLEDSSSGGSDEGRAILQVVHDVAPSANLAFYTAFNSEQDFASGIIALANAGCKVICDDVAYYDEPFFQNGIVAKAIQTVEQEGVVYVTAAGNDAANAYQSAWTPISSTSFDGKALADTESFGGSAVQTITVNPSGYTVPLILEWNQPYGAASSDLEVLVFRNGRFVGSATNASNGEPNNPWVEYDFTRSGTYQIAIENLSGPDPGLIKEIVSGDGLPVTISGANTGTVYGHAMTPGVITVGAVSAANTPAFGVSPPQSESFSSLGSGTELLFDNSGNPLAAPFVLNPVAVSGVDDINTTVSGSLSDFYGTSAATPTIAGIAALLLQANPNLTPSDIDSLLQDSSLTMANPGVAGAGLPQANEAVGFAETGIISPFAGGPTTLVGTHLGNIFEGTSGTYVFEGVGGSNVAQYSGAHTQYNFQVLSSGALQVTDLRPGSPNGTTQDFGIQFLQFSDGTFTPTSLVTVTLGGGQSLSVSSGQATLDTIILSGGAEYVSSGGVADATVISGGGQQTISAGGTASGTIINICGFEYVSSGGLTINAAVNGGNEIVSSGGTASGATLNGGNLNDFGSTSGTVVNNGGMELVSSGGSAGATIVNSGGFQNIYTSGVANHTTLSGTGAYQQVYAGGTALSAAVDSGATQFVYGGGTASGTVLSGGVENDFGTVNNTIVSSGSQWVERGGTASGTVLTGGYQLIHVGATATNTTLSDATQYDYGTANSTTFSGGTQYLYGVANNTVLNGGTQNVDAGGTASNTTLSGGSEIVYAGGTANGTITFAGGGHLTLYQAQNFSGILAGFNAPSDTLDLGNIPYQGSATTLNYTSTGTQSGTTIGTLTVANNGTQVANITLLGNYIAGTGNFSAVSDNQGGMVITDPPPLNSNQGELVVHS